ncbi:hypothetical protein WJU23_15320 [Prosthecobacter sp. SYSU 5D2]|uniref:hypothetical protein n=1 Tax=Prosthecobacter sp. SYSU 5D2 TaxID=3134134 RepID=UPI0031FE54D0
MSLTTLMHEAAQLDTESQRKLIGYLVSLRDEQMPGHRQEMARRIDDQTPEKWLTLDQLDAKLAMLDS